MTSYKQFMTENCTCEFCCHKVPAITVGFRSDKHKEQVGRCTCEDGKNAWENANGKALTGWEIAFALGKAKLLYNYECSSGHLPSAEKIEDFVFLRDSFYDTLTSPLTRFYISSSPLSINEIERRFSINVIGEMKFVFLVTDVGRAEEVIKSLLSSM